MKEEGRVEFLRNNNVYEDGANVTCQSEKGLILYEAYVKGDDTLYLVDDMTVSEDIIIPKDTVIDAGQYKMILTAGYSLSLIHISTPLDNFCKKDNRMRFPPTAAK